MLRPRGGNHDSLLNVIGSENLRLRPRRNTCPWMNPVRQIRDWIDEFRYAHACEADCAAARTVSPPKRLLARDVHDENSGGRRGVSVDMLSVHL